MTENLFTRYPSRHYLKYITETSINYIERICQEHNAIINSVISGPCMKYTESKNIKKNRFPNMKCWDHTRVRLINRGNDYIHANYVDGFEYARKFILTQDPMENTFEDFWTMIWQADTRVIVMLNGADGAAGPPASVCAQLEGFIVNVENTTLHNGFIEMLIKLFNLKTCQSRTVHFFKYLWWPVGKTTDMYTLITFLIVVNEKQQHCYEESMSLPGPMVVYCRTGTERAATFCAIDICMFQLVNVAIISIPSVVLNVRRQRHSSIQSLDHYAFINNLIIHFLATLPPNSQLSLRLLS